MNAGPEIISEFSINTHSAEETLTIGQTLGSALRGGEVIALVGPLGAGKTHFVKGLALGNGLGDVRQVTSPTFTLVQEYPGRLALYHVDAYRLSGARELEVIGFSEFFRADAAVAVEWANRIVELLPDDTLWIELDHVDVDCRAIRIRATGPISRRCLAVLTPPHR